MRTLLLNLNWHAMHHLGANRLNRIRVTLGESGRLYFDATDEDDGTTFYIYRKGNGGRNGSFVIPQSIATTLGVTPGFRYQIENRRGVNGFPLTMLAPIPLPGEAGHKRRYDIPVVSITERKAKPGEVEEAISAPPSDIDGLSKNLISLYRTVGRMNIHVSQMLHGRNETSEGQRVVQDLLVVKNQVRTLLSMVGANNQLA